jgi:protein-tyrosine phosphatase
VIDLHCHVLRGFDDGRDPLGGALLRARAAAEFGTRTIVATPHVSWRYDNDAATIAALVEQVNDALATEGVGVNVVAGAEVAMTRAVDLAPEQLSALTLGDGSWLLLECPFASTAAGLRELIFELQEQDLGIVLAHPERCPVFQRDPRLLETLVQGGGVLTSITAGSLVGRFGRTVKRCCERLIDAEMVHNVASDAHGAGDRRPGALEEIDEAGLAPLAGWLTEEVPAAILAGEDTIPARPRVPLNRDASDRGAWWRRGPLRVRRAS